MRTLLIVNRHKQNAALFAKDVEKRLSCENGMETRSISGNHKELTNEQRTEFKTSWKPDVVFSIGGDGTALFAAREFSQLGIPILPIHMGTTGFMSAANDSDWFPLYEAWHSRGAPISRRMMLQINIERKGRQIFDVSCLNDAVISSDGIAKIIRLNVTSNVIQLTGKKMLDAAGQAIVLNPEIRINIGSFRSDGIIASTATGSTAYSAAAGGPILDPEMDAIILNPICPVTLANRPIVIPPDESIAVEVEAEQRSDVILTVDGQLTEKLLPLDRIVIKKAPEKAILVGGSHASFYKALRVKLCWSGGDE